MNGTETLSPSRQAALGGLAVVGFISLIILGMWLAVYSARFVPPTVNRIGAAAVYLGSLFTPAPDANLTVVPTASTTIPFGDGTTTTPVASTTPATTTTPTTKPATPVAPSKGIETSGTYTLGSGAPALYGLPDLAVTITAVGYLATSSTSSFVPAAVVPHGAIPAVQFTVKNVGTNVAGIWNFSASIPTSTNYLYQSVAQQTLNPGDYIDFTLGFSQPIPGTNQKVTITVDSNNTLSETTKTNNVANATLTILGS
jgi:hypothetical protein